MVALDTIVREGVIEGDTQQQHRKDEVDGGNETRVGVTIHDE